MRRALGANCVRLQKLPQCWTQEAGWRVTLFDVTRKMEERGVRMGFS